MIRPIALIFSMGLACGVCPGQTAVPKLRLPTTVRPMRYAADLELTPGHDGFAGTIEIDLEIAQPVSTVWLHAKSLTLQHAILSTMGRELTGAIAPAPNDLVAITTPEPVPVGHALLRVTYTGEVSRTLTDGAFQQQQGDDWYIFTKFEPVTARRVFPCFDEPSFKVPWQLTLHVPKDLKAFSNTPIESEQDQDGGRRVVRFRQTKPLPSYLVAFAVGPFDVVETAPVGKNQIPSRVIVPHGRASEASYAAEVTPKLIQMLEDYFGTPYPYEKLDQIIVPLTTAWGAMENAGLIAYGDFLLSPKDQETELRRRANAETMEHEMSHQWFGDLVTTAWWDDIWLNEAFASWLSSKLLNEWKPEWNINADAARSLYVMHADSLTTARKIRQPIEAPGDIANAFDGITYGKGEAVIGMFENYMGAENFQAAIRRYLAQHAWGNATSADLLAALDNISPGVGAAFSTFLNQVGFPLIDVRVQCFAVQISSASHESVEAALAQHRFVPIGSAGANDQLWSVPVCFTWADDAGQHRACSLLTKPADATSLADAKGCPSWLFADANAAGYYAVSYDSGTSDKLMHNGLGQLKSAESAAALRNIQLMFSSGVGNPQHELTFVAGSSHSADTGLVRQAAESVENLNDLVPPALDSNYARLIRSLYDARARELGWTPHAGETQEIQLLRIEIVPLCATYGADAELASQAGVLAREWLKNRKGLDPDMVDPVLSTAAFNGDRAFFDLLVNEIKQDKIHRERSWMIGALSSFRDPAIAGASLELILEGGIDPRELQYVLFGAPRDTRELTWQFIEQNFDKLNATIPGARGIPFGAILPLAASRFCDATHRQQVEDFFKPRLATLPGGARNLANTLERIRLCSATATVIEPAIVAFLNQP